MARKSTALDEIVIYHFNDVYQLSDYDLVSKFGAVLQSAKCGHDLLNVRDGRIEEGKHASPPLVVFSGDAFSPSLESSVLKGDHMIPILNLLGIDVACYGNHDFDFGEERLCELSRKSNFPWLLSNAVHSERNASEGILLAEAQEYVVKTYRSYRIGIFGLAGTDWPSNCQHLPPCDIQSPLAVARRLARHLRTVEGCDFIIAVTHMRLVEDLAVSKETACGSERIDLILGGHDHEVVQRKEGDTDTNPKRLAQGWQNDDIIHDGRVAAGEGKIRVVKSGTNWRGLSVVQLRISDGEHGVFIADVRLTQFVDLTKNKAFKLVQPYAPLQQALIKIHSQIHHAIQRPLFHTRVTLEGRSTVLRGRESNLGNMIADLFRAFYGTDMAFANSGGIRCDRVIKPTSQTPDGYCKDALTVKDAIDILPFDNTYIVKRMLGSTLLQALENSVSDAHTDGRFLQVSGLRFVADWGQPEGQRVQEAYCTLRESTVPQEEPIRSDAFYTIAMPAFIANGFDGYSTFTAQDTLVGEEGAMTDTQLLLGVLGYENPETGKDSSPKTSAKINETIATLHKNRAPEIDDATRRARDAVIVGQAKDGLSIVAPRVEGRITFVNPVRLEA